MQAPKKEDCWRWEKESAAKTGGRYIELVLDGQKIIKRWGGIFQGKQRRAVVEYDSVLMAMTKLFEMIAEKEAQGYHRVTPTGFYRSWDDRYRKRDRFTRRYDNDD